MSSVAFHVHMGEKSLVLTSIEHFRMVNSVWIHRCLWNDVFRVIHPILRSQGPKWLIWLQFERSRLLGRSELRIPKYFPCSFKSILKYCHSRSFNFCRPINCPLWWGHWRLSCDFPRMALTMPIACYFRQYPPGHRVMRLVIAPHGTIQQPLSHIGPKYLNRSTHGGTTIYLWKYTVDFVMRVKKHLFQSKKLQYRNGPATRFTSDFSSQIRWKVGLAVTPFLVKSSEPILAHAATAELSRKGIRPCYCLGEMENANLSE